MNKLGMKINIRTQIRRSWSYIHSVVLRIGEDTLEVMGGEVENNYWINGDKGSEVQEVDPSRSSKLALSGFPVDFSWPYSKQRVFKIDLGEHDSITFKTFKDFVRVDLNIKNAEKLSNSLGLVGSYPSGDKLARDKKTIMDDTEAFGKEWQVLANEDMLFHDLGGVQAPMVCEMPKASTSRRLAESSISQEDAERACDAVETEDFEACVYDVLATSDTDMAAAY